MELPPWLKIENLIGNLNFTGWFGGWFRHENITRIDTVVNIDRVVVLSLNPDEKPKITSADRIYQEIGPKEQEKLEFTNEEKILVINVNKVHELCGRQGFDFEKNYKQALNHIREKPTKDWYECAAKDMVQAKEDVDFFNAFEEIKDPEKKELFDEHKEKINYLYGIIQKIKHSNKRGNVEEEFLSPYDKKFNNEVMTDEKYENVFRDFQDLLIELFKNFKLKDE